MDLSILFKVLFCIIIVKADVCEQRSPCSCIFPNGTGIDLAKSATTPIFISNKVALNEGDFPARFITTEQTYYFHPCSDVSLRWPFAEVEFDNCQGNWSICRTYEQLLYTDSTGYNRTHSRFEAVGTVNNSHFASDEDGTYIFYSSSLSTKVYLYCAEGEDKLLIRSWGDPNVLKFFSRNACWRQLETPVSELPVPRWIEMQWTKVTHAVKEGYASVVDGLKWLVPQPLERIPSFIGRI